MLITEALNTALSYSGFIMGLSKRLEQGSTPWRATILLIFIFMENKIYKLTDKEFVDLVKSSLNTSEVLFKLGYSTVGNSWGYS